MGEQKPRKLYDERRRRGGLEVVKQAEEGPPAAVPQEQALISLVLQDAELMVPAAASKGVDEGSWHVPAHRKLWATVRELVERGEPVELLALQALLEDRGELDYVGGPANLTRLWVAEPTAHHFEGHVEAVVAAAARRQLLAAAEAAGAAARSVDGQPAQEVENLLAGLRTMLEADRARVSVTPPEAGDRRPRVDVGQHVRTLARQLGEILSGEGFYRRAETRLVVTVAPDGRTEAMTARRLRAALEKHVFPVAYDARREKEVPKSLPLETAATILEADVFLEALPELVGVAPVRMPVWRQGEVALAPAGYDPESRVYCVDGVPFADDWTLEEAGEALDELLGGFEFPSGEFWGASRSGMLQVAVMMGTFTRWLLPPGTPRPLVAYVGNQPGTGKTLLASMAVGHVFGEVANEDYPGGRAGQDELKKILDVAAIDQAPLLWFDDVPEFVHSNALNRFVTASRHKPRILGKSEKLDVPNVTQVVLTGNHLRVTRDLIRRGLIVELFVPGDVEERQFAVEFTPALLTRPEWRARMLAACWAIVREWAENGAARRENAPLKGFSDYCGMVGGIMSAAFPGGADALQTPDLPMGGDEETEEIRRLLLAVAESVADGEPPHVLSLDEILEIAQREQIQLTDRRGKDVVGSAGDPPDKGARRSFGSHLKKWRGRHLRLRDGRCFEFGRRHQEHGAAYPLRFLT